MGEARNANDIDRRLGQRVRNRRLAVGMSQETLADLLGVTFQQVQKYEKGANRIAASRLLLIARALDLPVAAFYAGLADEHACKADAQCLVNRALAMPEGRALMALFVTIKSQRIRKRIVGLARALAEGQ